MSTTRSVLEKILKKQLSVVVGTYHIPRFALLLSGGYLGMKWISGSLQEREEENFSFQYQSSSSSSSSSYDVREWKSINIPATAMFVTGVSLFSMFYTRRRMASSIQRIMTPQQIQQYTPSMPSFKDLYAIKHQMVREAGKKSAAASMLAPIIGFLFYKDSSIGKNILIACSFPLCYFSPFTFLPLAIGSIGYSLLFHLSFVAPDNKSYYTYYTNGIYFPFLSQEKE